MLLLVHGPKLNKYAILNHSGFTYKSNKNIDAARKIQSVFRSFLARKIYTDVYIQRIAELENKLNEKEQPLQVNEQFQFSGKILDLQNFKEVSFIFNILRYFLVFLFSKNS